MDVAHEYARRLDHALPRAREPHASDPEGDDPLGCNRPLPHRAVFYPLGFAVEICSNAEAVLDIAHDCWGGGRPLHAHAPLQVRVVVSEGGPAGCPRTPVQRAQRNLLAVVADAHHHSICDLAGGTAGVWLSQAALRYPRYVGYYFIASLRVMVATRYATPLHAACVSRFGHGILLSGESGAGKSSLAYACARSGWTYTTDDGAFLLHGIEPRVVGDSHQIRFRPSARDLFPELNGWELTPRVEGKPSIEIAAAKLGLVTAGQAAVHTIVFLNREPAAHAELRPTDRHVALQRFRASLAPYPEGEFRQVWEQSLHQLVQAAEIYELRYSDLDAAVRCLDAVACGTGPRA